MSEAGLVVARRDAPGDGWLPASDLADLDERVAAVAQGAGTDLPQVGAQWLLELHAWQGASLTAAAMLSGRWVPDLAPGNVLVQLRESSASAIALRGGEPRPIEDDRELAAAAHAAVVRHVEPVIDALAARRLRGRRALWRAAGDRVGQAFLWCAAAFGAPARARRLGTLVLAPPSPMHVPLRVVTGEDGVPYHPRASCCLWHRVPPGNLCPGCPLHNAPRRRVTPAPGRSS